MVQIQVLLWLGSIGLGFIVLDEGRGDVCAGAHVSFIFGWQFDVLGEAVVPWAGLCEGHGRHDVLLHWGSCTWRVWELRLFTACGVQWGCDFMAG